MRATEAEFTRRLDPQGRVIFFSVRGRPMLFNGHTGVFYPSLPSWAEVELERTLEEPPPSSEGSRRGATAARGPAAAFRRALAACRSGRDPALRAEFRQTAFARPGAPVILNVFLAQACNLRCRYCINHYGTFGGAAATMSPATARLVVGWVRQLAAARPEAAISVNLFGGEPLLARAAAEILARGLQDLNHARIGAAVRVVLATNGTFYHERVFRILAERPDLCTVVFSLDGVREAHDRNRPFRNGRGSYAVVAAHLQRLISDRIPYSVTCVVTRPYDYIGAAEELHRLGVTRLELKDVIDHVFGGSEVPGDCTGDLAAWEAQYLAYTDYYLDYLSSTSAPALHVDRWAVVREFGPVLNACDGFERTLACGVADEKVAIAADGRIAPCEALVGTPEADLGHVREGLDPAKLARFADRLLAEGQLRIDHPRCRSCFAKRLCGGGCYAQCLEKNTPIEPANDRACGVVRAKLRIDLYFLARLQAEHPAVFESYGGIVP